MNIYNSTTDLICNLGGKDFIRTTIDYANKNMSELDVDFECCGYLCDIKEFLIVMCIKKELPEENQCSFLLKTLIKHEPELYNIFYTINNKEPLIASNFLNIIEALRFILKEETDKIKRTNLTVLHS